MAFSETEVLIDIGNFLLYLSTKLTEYFGSIASQATGFLKNFTDRMSATIADAVKAVNGLVGGLGKLLNEAVGSAVAGVANTVKEAYEKLQNLTSGVLDSIGSFVASAAAGLKGTISGITEGVGEALGALKDGVVGLVKSAVTGVGDFIVALRFTVEQSVKQSIRIVDDTYQRFVKTQQDAANQLFAGVNSTVGKLLGKIGDLKTSLEEAAEGVVQGLRDISDEARAEVMEKVKPIIDLFSQLSSPADMQQTVQALKSITTGERWGGDVKALGAQLFDFMTGAPLILQAIMFGILAALTLVQTLAGVTSAQAQILMHEFGKRVPYSLLPAPTAIDAWRRGLISEQHATETIQSQGLSGADVSTLFKLSENVPAEMELLILWQRKILDDGALSTALRQRGYDEAWISRLKRGALYIPPVQDLITMAVREVFSPEVAGRFGQFDDYPAELTEHAALLGMDAETARNYWAAHWGLPSPTMGFEMLHRGIIDKPDLQLLLRSLDVMPYWRDRVIQLSYSVYTRVDIRRMHAEGVLTRAEVYKAHLELGYDEEKAERLTEFVVKLNGKKAGDDAADLSSLSRSSILGFFRDGTISREQAIKLLVQGGASEQAARLYVDSEALEEQRDERKAQADLIIQQAAVGTMSFTEAQARLSSLKLEPVEIQKAMTRLIRAAEANTKLPSLADARAFWAQSIISEADFRDVLSRIGYPPKWVNAYVELEKRKQG